MICVSKPCICTLATIFLVEHHQSSSRLPTSGVKLGFVHALSHTCLAWSQWSIMWFTLSSSWSQTKQGEILSCNPCQPRLSYGHNQYWITSQRNILQERGSQHPKIASTY